METSQFEISKRKKRLLAGIWFISFIALGLSIELTRIYYGAIKDPQFRAICQLGEKWDCVDVAISSYSTILGIPNSVWGIAIYCLLIILIPIRLKTKARIFLHLENYLFLLSLWCVGLSIYLGLVSLFVLKTFCIYCIADYVANILFFIFVIFTLDSPRVMLRQFEEDIEYLKMKPPLFITVLVIALLFASLIAFLIIHAEKKKTDVVIKMTADGKLSVSIDIKNDPSLGPVNAPVTIIEFSDFQCPFCKKMHFVLKDIRKKYGDRIRIVYKNFPLDSECNPNVRTLFHPNSCNAAYASECAYLFGCFENFCDNLFAAEDFSTPYLASIARKCGMDVEKFLECLNDRDVRGLVEQDIKDADLLQIKGTPVLIINGYMIKGFRTKEEMEILIDSLLKGKKLGS